MRNVPLAAAGLKVSTVTVAWPSGRVRVRPGQPPAWAGPSRRASNRLQGHSNGLLPHPALRAAARGWNDALVQPEDIAALQSPRGRALLAELPAYDDATALVVGERLRRQGFDAPLVAAAMTQAR